MTVTTPAIDYTAVKARHFFFRYRSAEHWLDMFRTYYGPTLKALSALDGAGQVARERALLALPNQ